MVNVLPFRGFTYSPQAVQDLSAVTAPPYDVINEADQARLLAEHPANVVRLILNPKTPHDTESDNVYTRAAHYFQEWQHQGTLIPEAEPAFYAYTQSWDGIERKGLIGLLRLETFESGQVLPHERTLGGPKQDRLQLMNATMANLSQIFMIYSDPQRRIEEQVFSTLEENAWRPAVDQDGIVHRISAIRTPALVNEIRQLFEEQVLLIADGHHRYETALIFKQEVRQQFKAQHGYEPPEGALLSDYVMVFLTNMDDPGLKVFPTHRVLYRWPEGWSQERFETALFQKSQTVQEGEDWLYWASSNHPPVPMRWTDESALSSLAPELKELDVARLDAGVFNGIFGQTADALKTQGVLGFYRDEEELKAHMDAGRAVATFYVKAPPVPLIRQVSQSGLRMPQKSTYFYPKILSGLVLYAYTPFSAEKGHALSGVVQDAQPLEPGFFGKQGYVARVY